MLQDLVSGAAAWRPIGADGVDDGFGAFTLFDRFGKVDAALVVVAVGDEDDGLANGLRAALGEELVAAGDIDGVEERGAAARLQLVDARLKSVLVVGPVRGDRRRRIESHDEGAVALRLEHIEQELGGRLLLELEAGADGGAGINNDAHAQRQVDLLVKRVDALRRLLVIEKGKVVLTQVGDVVPMLVSDGEDEADFIDADMDGRRARIGGRCTGLRRGRGGCLRRGLSGRLSHRSASGGCRLLSRGSGAGKGNRKRKRGKTPRPRSCGSLRRGKLCVHHVLF